MKAVMGKEAVGGRPIVELGAGSREQTGDGVTAETAQGTQGERLRAVVDALLGGDVWAGVPELEEVVEDAEGSFFLRMEAGVERRRKASRDLSSTNHSTSSEGANSRA
jgi:hypothetical protein